MTREPGKQEPHQVGGPVRIEKTGAIVDIQISGDERWRSALEPIPAELASRLNSAPTDPDIYGLMFRSGGAGSPGATSEAEKISLEQRFLDVWSIERFSKPTVFAIDGAISGTGASLALAGTHRIALEGFSLSFGGIGRGELPEIGTSWRLRRLGSLGRYLALTGAAVSAAEALRLGLVTHVATATQIDEVVARYRTAEPIDQLLDQLPAAATAPSIGQYGPLEDAAVVDCFSEASVAAIAARLRRIVGTRNTGDRAQRTLERLERQPPTAAALTLSLLSEKIDAPDPIAAALQREYALAAALADAEGAEDVDGMVNEVLRQSRSRSIAFPLLQSEPGPIG